MNPQRWKQVDAILQSAMDRRPEDRDDFLRQACGGDEALERDVRSLLRSDQKAGSFLERPAIEGAGDNSTQTIFSMIDRMVSHYRVVERLGAGGMGVVYKAEDSRLGRFVALKFISEDLAGDSAWVSRFEREARILASLNHPSIAAIYGLEKSDGLSAIAMELVEGPTLAERMARGRVPVAETLQIAGTIAAALEYAHEQGIVHRDFKPGNVKLRPDGAIKVLDFGLAKPAGSRDVSDADTRPGVVMGTPAYMSPEQAGGSPVDRRTDVWAFGVVLFEMLSGTPVYARKTSFETLAAIARDEPPWENLPKETPAGVVHLLRRCLDKDSKRRLRDIGEARIALERGEVGVAPVAPVATRAARGSRTGVLALLVLATLAVVGAILMWVRRPMSEPPRQVVQFEISPPPGTIFTPTITRQPFAISPDGKRLALTATGANGSKLWIRDLASLEMRAVPGTEDVWSMYWTPDSRSIYFSVWRTLKQVNLDTGSLRTVAELPAVPILAAWRPNGEVLLFTGPGEIYELQPSDGSVRKEKVIGGMRWPQFLPGSDRLIYAAHDNASHQTHVATVDYANPKPLMLTQSDTRAIYSPSLHSGAPGYLLFVRGGDLLAQQFDADRLRLSGETIPVAQNVVYFAPNLGASISVSGNGVLAYQTGFPNAELKWYDRAGKEAGKVGTPLQHWGHVRLSRDGRRVAATVWSPDFGSMSLWLFDADGTNGRRFTFPPDIDLRPVWSPDGTRLAMGTSLQGPPQLGLIDAGGGAPEVFKSDSGPHLHLPTDWSRDGRFIAMDDGVGEEQHDAWIADVATRKMTPLLMNKFAQWGVAFAPDGKHIAFVSTESGRPEVYLQAFEPSPAPHAVGERRQVSRDGAWLTRWRADGRELFFLGLDNTMNAAEVQGPLQFGEPKGLFRVAGVTQYATTRDFQFDVSPDGQRFILPTTGTVAPPPVTVIENWQEKFRR